MISIVEEITGIVVDQLVKVVRKTASPHLT